MTLVYLAISFAVGILTGHVLRSGGFLGCAPAVWLFPSLVTSFVAFLFLLRGQPKARLVTALALSLLLGIWRYTSDPFDRCWTERDLAHYQSDEGAWATIEGQVIGFPDVQDRGTRYQLAVERLTVDGQTREVEGRAMVEAPRYPIYAYGDTLRVSALLLEPPVSDDFDYRRFLATRNIHSLVRRPRIARLASGGGQTFWRVLYGLRERGAAVVNRIMPEPAAALTNGMALGIEGGISEEVNDAFKATGTSHLIVISGSNIAFLAGALAVALGRVLPRRRAALAAAPFVLIYVLLIGADSPALRAGVMGLLGLGAVFFGRRGTAYVSLCAAGLVMLALNPLTLWDIGFQLSFMTSLGLILFSRPLGSALLSMLRVHLPIERARRLAAILDGTLIVPVAAQAAVLPLILCYFGRLSPVSLLTNCLVLPVQPAILAGGIAALLAGAAWQPIGQAVGTLPWLLLSYTVGVVRATAAVPFASVDTGRVGPLFVLGYYAFLAAACTMPRIARFLGGRPDLRRAGAWSALFVVPVSLSFFALHALPDGRLHVVFVPGEDGEAAVVIAPEGRTAWIWDGRGDGEALAQATRRGGFVRGKPDVVLGKCEANPWLDGPCIELVKLEAGAGIALTDEVRLTRLETGHEPALLVTYGQFRTVLPATLGTQAQEVVPGIPGLSILKAAGPGTGTWPSQEYLEAARPQLVLWPLETTYPPQVAEYLATQVATARVEARAAVEVFSDGQRVGLVRHSTASPH